MARPLTILPEARQSKTGALFDGAAAALGLFAEKKQREQQEMQRQQEEQQAAEVLAQQLSGLGAEQRSAALTKLAGQNPRLAHAISTRLGPAPVDHRAQMIQDWENQMTGYRPTAEQFDFATHGRRDPNATDPNQAVAGPAPAGFMPLPKDAAQAHAMKLARDAMVNPALAKVPAYIDAVGRATLQTPEDRSYAARAAHDVVPTANVNLQQTAANERNLQTTTTARRGQDLNWAGANLRATVAREGHGVTTAGHTAAAEGRDATGARQERLAEIDRVSRQISANSSELARLHADMQRPQPNTGVLESLQLRSRELTRQNQELFARNEELRAGAPVHPTPSTPKADRPNQYSAQAEALIQAAMDTPGQPSREVAIAALRADPRTAGLFQ